LHIKDRTPIHRRPAVAADRLDPGHWEADLMLFAAYGQAVLTIHERSSRLIVVIRQPDKTAARVVTALEAALASLPSNLRQTITFDNGTEFALNHILRDNIGIQTFFCDTHAPWQKGGIENAIGRLRRFLPRKTDLAILATDQIRDLACRYNHTPRKCLDFQTPAEVFSTLLHFKCESTFPLSRE
jgi:IS30 family transposase